MKRLLLSSVCVLFLILVLDIIRVTGHLCHGDWSVTIPDSDMGYKPRVNGMNVRVEGTTISADIVPIDRYTGNFALTDVPAGVVTLLLIENSQDVFTQASKRVQVDVSGTSATGITFSLVYHWKELAGYPAPWGTTGYKNEWTPHFVSDQVGFILFRVRGAGIDPERMELYRTLDGAPHGVKLVSGRTGSQPIHPGEKILFFRSGSWGN